jgi:hypothetical protein
MVALLTMPLTEKSFAAVIDAGCHDCKDQKILVKAIVAERVVVLEGEPHGAPVWAYKGEDLVRGTWNISCVHCARVLYTDSACQRCGAAEGVTRALDRENALPHPVSCASCGNVLLTVTAYVPVSITHEAGRASKPRHQTAPEEVGYHVTRIECKECHASVEPRLPCPLCLAP